MACVLYVTPCCYHFLGIQSLGEQQLGFAPEADQPSAVPKSQPSVSSLALMSTQAPLPGGSAPSPSAEQHGVDAEGEITDSLIEEIVGGSQSSEEEGEHH